MKIVALECGGDTAALVAVETWAENATLAGTAILDEPRGLSRLLLSRFDAVLQEAKWNLEEIDALAIGVGPGSWTSLRIGLAAFKTLALAQKIPLVGIPTFDALAGAVYGFKMESLSRRKKSKRVEFETQILLALSPCRPGEFYGKVFEMSPQYLAPVQGEWIAPAKLHLDAAYSQALASDIEPPIFICGDAAPAATEILDERGETYGVANASSEALALEIALAAGGKLAGGEAGNPLEVLPMYLAPSNAERVLAGLG